MHKHYPPYPCRASNSEREKRGYGDVERERDEALGKTRVGWRGAVEAITNVSPNMPTDSAIVGESIVMNPDDESVATYRQMADELRSLAAEVLDENGRRVILEIGTSYKQFVDQLENRSENTLPEMRLGSKPNKAIVG